MESSYNRVLGSKVGKGSFDMEDPVILYALKSQIDVAPVVGASHIRVGRAPVTDYIQLDRILRHCHFYLGTLDISDFTHRVINRNPTLSCRKHMRSDVSKPETVQQTSLTKTMELEKKECK